MTFAAVLVECFHLSDIDAEKLGRMFQIEIEPLKRLSFDYGTPETLHGGTMGRQHLCGQKTFHLILRFYAFERCNSCIDLLRPFSIWQLAREPQGV